MATRIEASNLSPDPMLREVWRAEHIFRDLGRVYTFGVVSKLPILLRSPRNSVGLFACDFPMSAAMLTRFKALEPRLMQANPTGPLFSLSDLKCIETMAHSIRQRALLEDRRAELFRTAYLLYRSLLLAMSYEPLTSVVMDLSVRMEKRFTLVTPIPDIHLVAPELRRRASHCFGGMALCALMGYENPMLCFGLASAAVCWEPARPLELVNLFRIHFLLFGRYSLGLVCLVDNGVGFVSDRPDEVRERMLGPDWKALMCLPHVCLAFTKQQVLPVVLRHGTAAMLECEREIVGPVEWEEVGSCFFDFTPCPLICSSSGPALRHVDQPAHRGPQCQANPYAGHVHAYQGGRWAVRRAPVRRVCCLAERHGE
jgi:hypothetical protein